MVWRHINAGECISEKRKCVWSHREDLGKIVSSRLIALTQAWIEHACLWFEDTCSAIVPQPAAGVLCIDCMTWIHVKYLVKVNDIVRQDAKAFYLHWMHCNRRFVSYKVLKILMMISNIIKPFVVIKDKNSLHVFERPLTEQWRWERLRSHDQYVQSLRLPSYTGKLSEKACNDFNDGTLS